MFELKTMLEYLDSLFDEFEIEKQAKKQYEDSKKIFDEKLTKTTDTVKNIYDQMDDIKKMYDLTEKDKMFSILINTSQIYIFILLFKTKKNFGTF